MYDTSIVPVLFQVGVGVIGCEILVLFLFSSRWEQEL